MEAEEIRKEKKVCVATVLSRPIPEELRRRVKRSTAELLGLSSLAETCTFEDVIVPRKYIPRYT